MIRLRDGHKTARGSVIIGTLFLILVVSILLMGMGVFVVSHLTLAQVDAFYAAAMDAAEAGINYELRSLTSGTSAHTSASPGTLTLGSAPWQGTVRIYCTKTDGTAISDPANPPSTILIWSVGTVGNISRTVQIQAQSSGSKYDYGIFSKKNGTINGTQTIQGSVGTAGTVTINGTNGISDKTIGLHGPTATATINPAGSYQTEQRPAITWPTVAQVAATTVPGGLTWLQNNNDNALATATVSSGILNGSIYSNKTVAAISSSAISANGTGSITFVGKAGGANYYLNGMTLNGTWNTTFDNSAGPINIWCATTSASASFTFNGGSASVSMASDSTKGCRIYVSDNCNLTLNGNGQGRFGVYAINDSASGGNVTLNGNNALYGSVICNSYTFNGTNAIYYTAGYFTSGPPNWTYVSGWAEINGR